MMKASINILLACFSSLLALFLIEGVLALFGFPAEQPVRAAHPPNYIEDREFIEFRYRFATNSMGLRYRELPREKPAGAYRVVVLGDSYTEGLGVEAAERFTNRLEQRFTGAGETMAFINGGLSGTAPVYYARLLKHVGLQYSPDAILVCIFANDVGNTSEDFAASSIDPPARPRSGAKGLVGRVWPRIYTVLALLKEQYNYRKRTQTSDFVNAVTVRAQQQGITDARIDAWIDSLPKQVVDAINANRFGFGVLAYGLLYPEFWSDSIDLGTPRSERKWQNLLRSLEAIVSLAEPRKIEIAMVFLPAHFQYDPTTHRSDNIAVRTGTIVRRHWLSGQSEVELRLQRWAEQRSIPFHSVTNAFRAATASGARLDYELDGHWTPDGHAVAAQAIELWLTTEDVFTGIGPPRATRSPYP